LRSLSLPTSSVIASVAKQSRELKITLNFTGSVRHSLSFVPRDDVEIVLTMDTEQMKELADRLDTLQAAKNDGRGVTCVRHVIERPLQKSLSATISLLRLQNCKSSSAYTAYKHRHFFNFSLRSSEISLRNILSQRSLEYLRRGDWESAQQAAITDNDKIRQYPDIQAVTQDELLKDHPLSEQEINKKFGWK